MTILWSNYEDMSQKNLQQQNLFTSTVTPEIKHMYNEDIMTIPWINSEAMKKITSNQKSVCSTSSSLDFEHKKNECTENIAVHCNSNLKLDLPDTTELDNEDEALKRKKRIKLRKKRKRYNESLRKMVELCVSKTNPDSNDQMESVEKNIEKKRQKLNKKHNRYRKIIAYETYSNREEPTVDVVSVTDPVLEKNQHTETQLTIPQNHNTLQSPVTRNTIAAAETEQNFQIEEETISQPPPQLIDTPVKIVDRENGYNNDNKKHTVLRSSTFRFPKSTFKKMNNSQHPPVIGSTVNTEHNDSRNQIDSSRLNQVTKSLPEHGSQVKDVLESEASENKLDDMLELEVVSQPEQNTYVKNISDKVFAESNLVDMESVDSYETTDAHRLKKHTGVRTMTLKIPISTYVEINNFLHAPIFGNTIQNTFKFIDPNNKQKPQLSTKLFDTITYYHEEPYCQLVGFKSHEIIFFSQTDHVHRTKSKDKKDYYPSTVIPTNDSPSMNTSESNSRCHSDESLNIRVPVIVGEYNIEICLEKEVLLEEKIYQVTEVSKGFTLTNCKFVPAAFSDSKADEALKASRGKLFLEGYIHQNIDYISAHNKEETFTTTNMEHFSNMLHQKIVLELMVQLLQIQKVTLVINQHKSQ